MVAFWGEEHRRYFTDWLVPSLLADGNLPALENRIDSKFLIATTEDDWIALHNSNSFLQLTDYIEPLKFPLDDDPLPIRRCGRAFALMTDYAHALKLYGNLLTADQVWSNNTVAELQNLAAQGYGLVLFPAARLSREKLFAAVGEERDLEAQHLGRIAAQSLHPEWDGYEWDGPYYPRTASDYWKRLPDGGVLRHAVAWQPMLLDYSKLPQHTANSFASGHHYDGGYIWDNLSCFFIKPITDDQSVFAASFTDEARGPHYEPLPKWLSWCGPLRRLVHADALRQTLRLEYMRNFPPNLVLIPIRWGGEGGTPLPLARHIGKRPYFLLWLLTAHWKSVPKRVIRRLWLAAMGDPESRERLAWRWKQLTAGRQ